MLVCCMSYTVSLQVLCISEAGKEVEQYFLVGHSFFTILSLWIFLPLLATTKNSDSSLNKLTKMSCNSVLIILWLCNIIAAFCSKVAPQGKDSLVSRELCTTACVLRKVVCLHQGTID